MKAENKKNTSTRKRVERNIYQDLKTGHYLVTKYGGYDENGIHRSTVTCRSLPEAKRELEKHELERKYLGKTSLNTQITVAQCIEEYIDKKNLAETTKSGYKLRLKRIAVHPIGKKKIASIKKRDICEYLNKLEREGRLSNKTINGDRQLLQAVFNHAIDYEYITHNVVNLVPKKQEDVFEGTALTKNEVLNLIREIEKCEDVRLKTIVSLGVLQGLRRGEISGLKWSDIIQVGEKVKIAVHSERVPTGGTVIEKSPKTKSSRRTIPLQTITQKALDEYHKLQSDLGILSDYIVLANKGTPIYPNQINNMLSNFLKRAKMQHVRLHDLRHTCCTLLVENEAGYSVTSKYLGHSSSRTTERIYTHLRDDITESTVDIFTDIFGDI